MCPYSLAPSVLVLPSGLLTANNKLSLGPLDEPQPNRCRLAESGIWSGHGTTPSISHEQAQDQICEDNWNRNRARSCGKKSHYRLTPGLKMNRIISKVIKTINCTNFFGYYQAHWEGNYLEWRKVELIHYLWLCVKEWIDNKKNSQECFQTQSHLLRLHGMTVSFTKRSFSQHISMFLVVWQTAVYWAGHFKYPLHGSFPLFFVIE